MEPIVTFLSVWVGFAWAVIFLGGTATMLVFEQYGFGPGQTGSTQACIIVGGVIGYFSQFHQEKIYRKVAERSASGHAPPEARLYWAAFGGLLFPAGMMAFAWTGRQVMVIPKSTNCQARDSLARSSCDAVHLVLGCLLHVHWHLVG